MERKVVESLKNGTSFNNTCKLYKIGRNRLAHIREKALEYGYLDGRVPIPPYPEALFPDPVDGRSLKVSEADKELMKHKDWIVERLEAGWYPVTIHEELPVSIGRSSFYRFLHRYNLPGLGEDVRRKIVSEIIYKPGQALIVDWGKLRDVIDPDTGKKRSLWAFIGILGHCRYMMVRLVFNIDVSTTLSCLEDMLKELGGVPERIISDNPKCFSLKASKYEPLLNPAYERFAAHYGTQIECLPPASPKLKGKVERMVPFVRRLYQAHGNSWHGLTESEEYMQKKVVIANERIHGTTRQKPVDILFQDELPALKSLPEICYEVEEFHEGKVRRDSHVRFRSKYYSVEEKYIGKEVVVIGNSKHVSIYFEGRLIEVHNRVTESYKSKSTKPSHMGPWNRAIEDGAMYRKRALKLGPYVEKIVLYWLMHGNGFIDTRKIWGVLSLDKKYPSKDINDACRKAIELQTYSYRAIVSFLELKKQPLEDEDKQSPDKVCYTSKFTRSMKEYEQLLINLKG